EEINQDLDQGVGRPFKVIHTDAHGKLEAFESEAVRLAAVNRVSFLLGGTTAEEVERLDRAHVPVVTPLGARPRMLSDGVSTIGIPPTQRGKVLARFAAQQLGGGAVLLLSDDRREDAVETAEAFGREYPAAVAAKDAKAPAVVRRLPLPRDDKT